MDFDGSHKNFFKNGKIHVIRDLSQKEAPRSILIFKFYIFYFDKMQIE